MKKIKESFYNQIMMQIKPSLLMSFPDEIDIHNGVHEYYKRNWYHNRY